MSSPQPAPWRVVLLVARPIDMIIDRILYKLGVSENAPNYPTLPLDTADAPSMADTFSFATHLAVALLDTNVWLSPELTLPQKMELALYWEHLGTGASGSITKAAGCGIPGSGKKWDTNSVTSIRSVNLLGEVQMTDNEVSNTSKSNQSIGFPKDSAR